MSSTALDFTRRRLWCDWQEELTEQGARPHRDFFDQCARVKRDAAFLIGFMA